MTPLDRSVSSSGRFMPGVKDAIVKPYGTSDHPVIVYGHGAGGDASEAVGMRGYYAVENLVMGLAAEGYEVRSITGTHLYGNAEHKSRMMATGATNSIPIGCSMGAMASLIYAAAYPVSRVVGIIPVVDPETVRNTQDALLQINEAWGVTPQQPLPPEADIMNLEWSCPVQLWYAYDDPFSYNIDLFLDTHPYVDGHDVGPLGHSQNAIAAVDLQTVLDFLN